MEQKLLKKASKLASRSYLTVVVLDETTDGQPVYLARNPELPNCLGQGVTYDEAVQDLGFARIDYIYSLLEDGLPVPDPTVITRIQSAQPVELSRTGQKSTVVVETVINFANC